MVYSDILHFDTDSRQWILTLNKLSLSSAELLYLCAILNSFVVDGYLRHFITTHASFFFVYNTPVPRLTEKNAAFMPIVERAARLICTTPEYDDLAREVGLRGHQDGVTDPAERAKLRAELDGRIAHLYGLTEDEFTHILATFPLVPQAAKDAALDAYRAYADTATQEASENAGPPSEEALLRALIAGLETDTVEFKIGARWNPHRGAADDTMRDNIAQAVAAFLNSEHGGTLLIGVASDGTITGLEADFTAVNAQHPGPDSYANFLRSLIGDRCGGHTCLFCRVTFPAIDGKTLCRIDVRPADAPVYLGGALYVRDGNGKRNLNVQDAVEYLRRRWAPKGAPAAKSAALVDPSSSLFAPQTMMDMGRTGEADAEGSNENRPSTSVETDV